MDIFADFPRRNSFGGREGAAGSFYRDLDDKENGKDSILKPWKARSPAASSKGAKNFMSPTISASSKVTVSPRKKVLGERNEPARVSAPSAAIKSPIRKVTFAEPLHYSSDLKPEGGVGEKKFEVLSSLDDGVPKEEVNVASSFSCEELCGEVVCDVNVPFNVKDEAESSFETVIDEPDSVNLDPSFKLSPTPTPPLPVSSHPAILAPLDADPLMPPYDPKTNYLSPRPQFLHYKPKQRIELDDSLVYGSFSDTEVTEDSQSEGSQKESEDVSSDERVEEKLSPAKTLMDEETVEAEEKPKPRLFMRRKATIALLLLLSVAFISISVTNSPMMDGTVFQDVYRVYESSEFSEFARANFNGLSRNFHTWFTKSLSSISELISNVRGVHSLGHLQYYNLTVLHEYNAVDQGPIFGHGKIDIGEAPEVYPLVLNVEDSNAASAAETDEDIGDVLAEHYDSVYEEQAQQDMGVVTASDDAPDSDEVLEGQPANVIESAQAWQLAEMSEPDHSEVEVQSSLDSVAADIHIEVFNAGNLEAKHPQEDYANVNVYRHSNVGIKDQPGLDSEVAEILSEVYGDKDMNLIEADGESISMDAAAEDNQQRLKTIDLQPRMLLYLLLSGGTVLIAGAAFNWSRKCKSRSTRVTSSVEQPFFAKAFRANSLLTPKQEQSYLEKQPSLRNGPIEIDVQGESCPSEMSSVQKSSSYRQKLVKEFNEVQSIEKAKKRRESLATSSDYSMGSTSYGSFTTYEKIQIKNVSICLLLLYCEHIYIYIFLS